MKLTKNWHNNKTTHKTKYFTSKPKKIPFQLLGLPAPPEAETSSTIDEVRRQAVLMSSHGFREALQSSPSTPLAKVKAKREKQKPRRKAIK